jgi:hypothetical protein
VQSTSSRGIEHRRTARYHIRQDVAAGIGIAAYGVLVRTDAGNFTASAKLITT